MAAATPTIVLVHGAWADATGFDAEIRALRDRGYTALGFGNPLRDLAGDAAYLAASRSRRRRCLPGRAVADPERSDRACRPFLWRQCDLHRRHRQRAGPGARLHQRLDVRRG